MGDNGKHAGGRPSKKNTLDLDRLVELASTGMTDVQLGAVYGVTEKTINEWKKDEKVSLALKKGKDLSDSKVERSLFERALGYTHPEEKIFIHNGKIIRADTVKHYPPEVAACIFWLKNRKRLVWRDRIEPTTIVEKHTHFTNVHFKQLEGKSKQELVDIIFGRINGVNNSPKRG